MTTPTFVESFLRGEVDPGAIYAFADAWHQADTDLSLPAFLGISEEEYAAWLERPERLAAILAAHAASGQRLPGSSR